MATERGSKVLKRWWHACTPQVAALASKTAQMRQPHARNDSQGSRRLRARRRAAAAAAAAAHQQQHSQQQHSQQQQQQAPSYGRPTASDHRSSAAGDAATPSREQSLGAAPDANGAAAPREVGQDRGGGAGGGGAGGAGGPGDLTSARKPPQPQPRSPGEVARGDPGHGHDLRRCLMGPPPPVQHQPQLQRGAQALMRAAPSGVAPSGASFLSLLSPTHGGGGGGGGGLAADLLGGDGGSGGCQSSAATRTGQLDSLRARGLAACKVVSRSRAGRVTALFVRGAGRRDAFLTRAPARLPRARARAPPPRALPQRRRRRSDQPPHPQQAADACRGAGSLRARPPAG
jgi:hypothetical protein